MNTASINEIPAIMVTTARGMSFGCRRLINHMAASTTIVNKIVGNHTFGLLLDRKTP